ncbi:PE domain-containing protein [Mycolicibacterium iranicum]|uniref:PE domain-containing protein n=1 Tax=Mycolicibacterium iranicum TaxID=912594 RepID=A0ABT4HFK9_MYCIR|nr:PE domain-containing protein [Mycolicibacterium iranicum]MCZ0728937.1 PE domain-containing protein [Mycolicibacterium iranicum]
MGNPPPLRVDTTALSWDPAVVAVPPVPAIPPGGDPMSLMISAIMPELPAPLNAAVAATHAREERFAANLATTRAAYETTDQANQQQISTVADTQIAPTAAAAGTGSGTGGGQFGQIMGTAMQVAGQAAQAPAQVLGMVAQAPQAVMQAGQGAVQQISQMTGQFGKSENGEASGGSNGQVPEHPTPDRDLGEQTPVESEGESQTDDKESDSAAAGTDASERAPDVLVTQPSPSTTADPIDL